MFLFRDRPVSIMVLYCVVLHLWWMLMVSIDSAAINATGVNALFRVFTDRQLLAAALGGVSVLAVAGMFMRPPWVVWCLMPQQFMLLMSASGAISAIWSSQFADGVVRPRGFIAADQFYIIIAALGHTLAVIAHARRRGI